MSSPSNRLLNTALFIALAICLLLFVVAICGYRLEFWRFGMSAKIIRWGIYLAMGVGVAGIGVFIKALIDKSSVVPAIAAVAIAVIPVAMVVPKVLEARSVPKIHDITTDLVTPPAFDKVVLLRGDNSNPLDRANPELAKLQSDAYPDIQPIVSQLTLPQAIERAADVAESLGWEVVNLDQSTGLVEAVVTTPMFGFKDDVVVRVTRNDGDTRIDLRSVSRVGRSDLGANAARIRRFIQAF
ncbi:DUF1499 domain-containing protein [bacterium SCSIO 12696]|nr:DUF1499 domain-containing protein [bacterium SCSIO 12696]